MLSPILFRHTSSIMNEPHFTCIIIMLLVFKIVITVYGKQISHSIIQYSIGLREFNPTTLNYFVQSMETKGVFFNLK